MRVTKVACAVCCECLERFSEVDVLKGRYDAHTLTCIDCIKLLVRDKRSCFGKAKYFSADTVCGTCQDRRLCARVVTRIKCLKTEY